MCLNINDYVSAVEVYLSYNTANDCFEDIVESSPCESIADYNDRCLMLEEMATQKFGLPKMLGAQTLESFLPCALPRQNCALCELHAQKNTELP